MLRIYSDIFGDTRIYSETFGFIRNPRFKLNEFQAQSKILEYISNNPVSIEYSQ